MKIKSLLMLAGLSCTAISYANANEMFASELYKQTQSTYTDDIDTINIVFASMDRACRKNSPYGTAYQHKAGLVPLANCGVINESTHKTSHLGNTQYSTEVFHFQQFTMPYYKKADRKEINAIGKHKTDFPERDQATLNVVGKLYDQMIESQKDKDISGQEFKFSAPQVITVLSVYNIEHPREVARHEPANTVNIVDPKFWTPFYTDFLIQGLDALTGKVTYFEVSEDGKSNQITGQKFFDLSAVYLNPLYVGAK